MTSTRALSIAVLLLCACGDDSTLPFVDSGPSDAGQDAISFDASPGDAGTSEDVGTPSDAGAPSDAGGDSAIDGGACLFSLEDGLSDECFPACVEGSRAAALSCIDYDCYLDIFEMGDGTGLQFETGNPQDNALFLDHLTRINEATESCHQCATLVTRACEYDVCPEESAAFFDCFRGADGPGVSCFPRSMAITECANLPANQATYYGCYDDGLQNCFQ